MSLGLVIVIIVIIVIVGIVLMSFWSFGSGDHRPGRLIAFGGFARASGTKTRGSLRLDREARDCSDRLR
jgi:hypothetical protein